MACAGGGKEGPGQRERAQSLTIMVNGGAAWVDEPLVVDGNLISSRTPADLPFFAKGMVDWLSSQKPRLTH